MLTNASNLHRTVVIFLAFCGLRAQGYDFAGGTGEPGDPYQIATAQELISIGSDSNLLNKCFVLISDVDLDPNLPGGQVFAQPVIAPNREDTFGFQGTPFTGSLDGDGHTIKNLTIQPTLGYYIGLFGNIGTKGYVERLRVENVFIGNSRFAVGGLAGVNHGTIVLCRTTGSVYTGPSEYIEGIGGLVGSNDGRIFHSCASTSVRATANSNSLGGLVGINIWGRIIGCHASGEVLGYDVLGGLVGNNVEGTITDCYATGSLVSNRGFSLEMGGLVGHNQAGTIVNCYAAAALANGKDKWDWGGLVGRNSPRAITLTTYINGIVANSFWDTDVSGVNVSDGGMGLATAQMQTAATFIDAGWDFEHIWMICEGRDYPHLQWEEIDCARRDNAVDNGGRGRVR